MCKAGFAGDDAPRAVFRKFPSFQLYSDLCLVLPRYLYNTTFADYSIASIVGRPRHHGYNS